MDGIRLYHAAGAGPDGRGPRQPHAVPVQPRGRRRRRAAPLGADGGGGAARAARAARRRHATSRTTACRRRSTIDRATASRLGITPQMVDDTLYDAFGQRQISTIFTQLNQYRVVLEVAPEVRQGPAGLDDIYVEGPDGGAGAAAHGDARDRDDGAARRSATRGSSRRSRCRSTWRPASRSARRSRRSRRRPAALGMPAVDPRQLPGHRAGLPGVARERAAAHPGRAGHRLHRAGRALRELHPPGDDPLDAALGRRGRAPGAAALPAPSSA